MRIAVVGSGYVGLVAGACFADLGHEVLLVDNDQRKLDALNSGQVPIHEKFLPELLSRHRGHRMTFSDDLKEAVRLSSAIFVAVGTPPTESGEADLSYVESVAREISGGIDDYKVIVEKSTVPVYTSDWVRKIILRNGADPDSFDVASNPEFLREGTAVTDFLFPDRIVVGCDGDRSAEVLRAIYAPLTDGSYYEHADAIPRPDRAVTPPPLIVTSTKSAELIKHASNAFLAMKISFINAVASVCESVGADVNQVVHGVGTDSRIGSRFLNPGIGYGGSCFPKDVMAFRSVARECGYDFRLLDEVMRINEDQRHRFLRKVRSALWTLRGKNLAVLGLAFKGGTDDIRESPALILVQTLLQEGSKICAYDPAAIERTREVLGSAIVFANSAYDAAHGADALLILTEWEEFANLDLSRLRQELRYPIVIDGRNLYDPDVMATQGFTYYSVGRSASHPDAVPAGVLKNGKKG
ncbi:MAG: UDP-glucose/GDP-mannose dehydrogenase family protein [Candidatus Sulfotelmatobacter sp.]|jgi:UDPglucose 6-dehydrogenase